MLELGDGEVEYHIEIANSIDASKIDSVFTFGNLSKVITDKLFDSFLEGQDKHFTSKVDLADVPSHTSRGLKLEDICYLINK